MSIFAALTLLLIVCALAYWIRQGFKQAKRVRNVFAPLPRSPSDHDSFYMSQQLRDSQIEREWRERVAQNELSRKERRPMPSMLIRQAD